MLLETWAVCGLLENSPLENSYNIFRNNFPSEAQGKHANWTFTEERFILFGTSKPALLPKAG